MKDKDTLLLNNTINRNPILAKRAWFWHVASHIFPLTKTTFPLTKTAATYWK